MNALRVAFGANNYQSAIPPLPYSKLLSSKYAHQNLSLKLLYYSPALPESSSKLFQY
jgi:hypothetical protein